MRTVLLTDLKLIEISTQVLNDGGLVIFPTETAYGIGVDATNHDAVSKLLKYKKRPEGKAISIGCSNKSMAEDYVFINPTADNIYKQFLPGPVTVISKSKNKVDKRLESENGSLGVRIPNKLEILKLIESFEKPITTTSANSAGKKTPYSVDDILSNLSENQKGLIDLIIDGGDLEKKQTSTVIDTTTDDLKTYRQGKIEVKSSTLKAESYKTGSVEETIGFGEKLMNESIGELSTKPLVFLLNGEMGAGKTHFVKGIAKALGITRTIKSPTYNYVSEYKFNDGSILYHMDAWRIETVSDLNALEINSWMKPNNIIVVEWPEIIERLQEKDSFEGAVIIKVDIKPGEKETQRIFKYTQSEVAELI